MKYDFTSIPDRSKCGSNKWLQATGSSVNQVPLSTADMEFPTAPEIVSALKKTAEETILGYTSPTKEYFDAVCGWMEKEHNFHVEPDWMIQTPGIVYAFGPLIKAMTKPGESIIILTPVYYPFDLSVMACERNIVYSELKTDGKRYTIDYDDLEKKAAKPECTLLMFCNPHNPVGRVWSEDELKRVVDICYKNNVLIIDDEIHNDLIMPRYKHTVMANVSKEAAEICAVCTAPSKTFNLAGLQCSNIIIPNPKIRAKVMIEHTLNLLSGLNVFAYSACTAAYNEGKPWLEELIRIIEGNAKYVEEFMAENFPEINVYPLEGTYLQWLDMRKLGLTHKELEGLMKEDAKLFLDEGYVFGMAGRGFERINLACSRKTIENSMNRFKTAVDAKGKNYFDTEKAKHMTLKQGEKMEGFVYDTCNEKGIDLSQRISKPTAIIFSRYYDCPMCQTLLNELKNAWPMIKQAGIDLKVVLQSGTEKISKAAGEYPFDLICDPQAKLYDKFDVFEADSQVELVGGNSELVMQMGGIRNVALSAILGDSSSQSDKQKEGRGMQLPAVFVIMPDMTVAYAHYSENLTDIPNFSDVMKQLG